MKIVIAHNWSDEGFAAQSKLLAEHLSIKHEVVFFSHTPVGSSVLRINPNLTVYQWIGKRPTTWPDFKLAFKVLRSFKPDVAIGNFGASTLLALTGWLLRVPCRIEFYHTLYTQLYLDSYQKKWLFKLKVRRKAWLYRMNNYIFTSNEYGITDLNRHYNIPKKMCIPMPNGMPDHSIRNEYTNPILLKFAARIDKSKGLDILLKAMQLALIERPALRLEVAGTGPQLDALKKEATSMGLDHAVKFVGKLPLSEITSFIAGASMFVMPSRIDNHPTVIMIAYSTGTPVIGANSGGIPEMILNNETGFIFDNEDYKQLAQKIIEATSNSAYLKKLGQQARKRYESFYTVGHFINRMEKQIELLASSTSK